MPNAAVDRPDRIVALRKEISGLVLPARTAMARLPFGIAEIDGRLAGGSLVEGAVHEVAGETSSLGDDAAASLFAAGIATRAGGSGQVLWIRSKQDLFAPGLAVAGLPASRLILVDTQRDEETLAAMEDGLRHGGLAAVVCEVARADTTATRRLQLVAEEGRTIGLLLRRWRRKGADPLMVNSTASTRWRIGCASSTALPVAGVGRPRWTVALVRQRGGEPWTWLLEGCDAQGRLALPAESRDRSAAPARRDDRQAA